MSRAEFYTLERKKVTIYADFLTSFDRNPTTDNLALNINENAVKRAIRNIVLTNRGERFYDSKKGCNTRGSLFQNFDPATLEILRLQIEEAITRYEPRANPIRVDVVDDIDRNAIHVRVSFQIINIISDPIQFDLLIEKVR